jgi:hypothetical protein
MIEAYLERQGFFEYDFLTTAQAMTASYVEDRFGATQSRPRKTAKRSPLPRVTPFDPGPRRMEWIG